MAVLFSAGAVLFLTGILRWAGLFLLVFAACQVLYTARIADRLDPALAGTVQTVHGTVTSIPTRRTGYLRFRFDPAGNRENTGLPSTLLVSWYREWPEVRIGQQWALELRLKPPWGIVNFHGPDKERWLFAEGIGGLGTVRGGNLAGQPEKGNAPAQRLRSEVAGAIRRQIAGTREQGVIQALATADRSGIGREDNHLLRVTGTAHLLAISGLHIGLAAMGGLLATKLLVRFLPVPWAGRAPFYLVLALGVATAGTYAVLANLGVSTVRALLMLLAGSLALSTARSLHPFRVFFLALFLVLAFNPFAPLSAGFWFSFMAVFSLLSVFQPRCGGFSWWKTALAAQVAVFLVLLPVNAAWLGGVSLAAFPANLLAIPWVSVLVVPPVLAGVAISPASESAAGAFWSLAGFAVNGLFPALEWIGALQPWLLGVRPVPLPLLLAATVGALMLLLPRGLSVRWLGVFFLLPLAMPAQPPAGEGALRVDVLDVGQGTAVAVSTHQQSLLYDTGPGDGAGSDLVASAISPLFSALGKRGPDRVVVSHGDLDHTGGLGSLRTRYPDISIQGSVRAGFEGVEKCTTGERWDWGGFEFRVLHPSDGLPYLGNNSSCVLAIGDEKAGLLLPGDIDGLVENRLLMNGVDSYPLMLVPHHGSNSSSGAEFIGQVAPSVAIAPAGLGNRFGFPREEVRERYVARGIDFWSTGECGGIRLLIGPDGSLVARSARRDRKRIWRWPVAAGCP